MSLMLVIQETAINMQNLAFSEVSDGPYCNSNVKCGAETYTAYLIFMW